jgi:SAM-dependent methyltransferase
MTQPTELLLPPKDLIYRVAGTSDSVWFVQSGKQSVRDIEAALASVGHALTNHARVLDFGCGCGRIMLQLRDVMPLTRVTGVDIDQEAIAWLRPRVPNATVLVINELPPIPFAEATFDLIYCHSVFTHLDENYQDLWLEELRRISKPSAVLVVSFSGQKAVETLEEQWIKANADPAPMRKQLEDSGILYITDDEWKNGPFPEFYHSSFHTIQYVKEHWGKYFKILNHLPCGSLAYQDFVLMQRVEPTPFIPKTQMPAALSKPAIPMPPAAFRALVGPTDDIFYDNPTGESVFPEVPAELYASVFDFGSGCGRQARQLMQQNVRPDRYVGIDIHRSMVAWCQANLSRSDSNFHFLHHNVYNPGLGPDNIRQLTAPFPVGSGEFTLVNAHSIFTHLYQNQTEFYLREIHRILTDEGLARTTWFFFDRKGYPWLEKWQNSLFVNAEDPTNAVIYDLAWFLETIRSAGLAIRQTVFPATPGHQWQVFLEKRKEGSVDRFPRAEEAATWICGAGGSISKQIEGLQTANADLESQIKALTASRLALSNEVRSLRNSWSWILTRPIRYVAGLIANR